MIIYDCEIIKAIPPKNPQDIIPGIEYCEGWRDFKGMGISVIAVYDYLQQRYSVYLEDNMEEFLRLAYSTDVVVGFNSLSFDNNLVAANGIDIDEENSYDILVEIWKAAGLSPTFKYPSHIGYSLDSMCETNFGIKKTGSGALAPILWQQGKYGQVIDYCLHDVWMTKKLLDQICIRGRLLSSKNPGTELKIDPPRETLELA